MWRVIFQDVDGVLNNVASRHEALRITGGSKCLTPEQEGEILFDPENVRVLNTIIEESQAQLVISSDWRLNRDLDMLRRVFQAAKVNAEIVSFTPYLGTHRGYEIMTWLHRQPKIPDQWCILDDNKADMGWMVHKLVEVDGKTGLTEAYIPQVMAFFQ